MEKRRLLHLVLAITIAITLLMPIYHNPASAEAHKSEMLGFLEGWSDDIRITFNASSDSYPAISTWDNSVNIVWRNLWSGQSEIYFINSNDAGKTWNDQIRLSPGNPIDCMNPDIAVNGEKMHVVWNDNNATSFAEIRYRTCPDGGTTWNPEKMISTNDGFNSEGPKVFVNNSNIHIFWMDLRDGADGEIYYRRSLDGGITFDNGQGVDADRRITFSPAAIGGPFIGGSGSNISVAWGDFRNGVFEVYWMISKDNGFTWEDGQGNVGLDRRLTTTGADVSTIAMNGSNIYIVYVDPAPGPVYSLYYINSSNSGATWSIPQLLTGPNLYSDRPDIAADESGIHLVWFDRRDDGTTHEIYYKNSTDGGISWSGDIRLTYSSGYDSLLPQIALANSNRHIVWYDNRDGNTEIYYKRFPDFPTDATPPTVTYISPPTPPNNSTYVIGQRAIIRVHYFDNESAASNATLFWKNSTGFWNTKPMANISFWNGSYNNYFEANFTESSPTTVIYYVNCTSSANLTTMAPIRTMNFADISVNDPYPIYGYVYLYNGNVGTYNPLPLANTQVEITWWNVFLNDWQTIITNTIATGQYSVDLMNYTNGGVVFCNATAPATFNNRGYNWTLIDIVGEPGGRQQNIVCGVPYNLEIMNYPLSTPVNTPFSVTYEIQDIDGLRCQGYYTFFDGPMNISANGSYSAPPDYTFDGLLSGTPGTRTETITLGLPLGQRWLNVSEGLDLNPYLTPWGAFSYWNGTPGFLKDWDNVTINVTGAGFLWRLEQGWNLICVPASPVQKGSNGIFDSFDALNICFGITGAAMCIADRTGGNPSTYNIFDYGMPENLAFPMDGVHGYWLYLSAPGPFVVNVTAQNYSVAGANTINLAVGWNLLGFTHNISAGGLLPGGWNSALTASHFTNGNVDSDLDLPPMNKIVVTWWDPIVQWYHSYVVTPTFPGMPTHDWAYDTTYAYGYWVWADSAVQVSFDTDY